jgi:hypothetical protein
VVAPEAEGNVRVCGSHCRAILEDRLRAVRCNTDLQGLWELLTIVYVVSLEADGSTGGWL